MKKRTDELLKSLMSKDSFDDFLKENEGEFIFDSLSDWIEYYLITKKLKKSDVISASNIGREYGYQLINGTRKPSRDKLIMLCFGLRLTLEETQHLLKYMGFGELYVRNIRDAMIMDCIRQKRTIVETNIMLEENKHEPLE